MSTAADVRPQLAIVAEGLDEVSAGLQAVADLTTSPTEREALAEAARDAAALARRLRNLIHFAGVAGARSERVSSAPEGSRPSARPAGPARDAGHDLQLL